MAEPRRLRGVWRAALLAVLACSALLPLALLVVSSLARGWFYPSLVPDAWSGDAWRQVAGGRLGGAAVTSVWLGIVVGLLATAAGLAAGRAMSRLTGWQRHLGAALVFLPVAAPPIALGTGVQYAFIRAGLAGTLPGVVLAHAVPATGFLALYFLGVFSLLDPALEDEARTLGASPLQVVTRVLVPALRRQVGEAFALGFLISWAQVPLTLVVGGGLIRTLPLEVFAYLGSGQDRYAAVGALLLTLPPVLALAATRYATRRASVLVA